ncbi:MAG: sialidase family protein [Pirellulaceae bacterium]
MFCLEDCGLILDAAQQPPQARIAYFTSLCMLRSDTILCGCQNGPVKHAPTSTIRLCRSRDRGQTWELLPVRFESRIAGVPGSLGAAELVEVAAGRLLLFSTWFDRSDPARPLFDPLTEGILKSKQLLSVSDDEGESWSPWHELSTGDLRGCALTGPVLRWDDGTIAVAFESFKEFDDPRPGRHAAWLIVSRDGGESFSEPMLVAQHPEHEVYYWDQRLCAGARVGDFTALFWTHSLAEKRDLTVHLRHAVLTGESIAGTPIRATPIPGQIAAPLRLDDGRLLAFVVNRGRPGTMTLWCSHDGGETWPTSDRLTVYTHDERAAISQGQENIDFKQYWEDMGKWSFGHPVIRSLAGGRVLLAWYAGTPDCMSLHWARVRLDERISS